MSKKLKIVLIILIVGISLVLLSAFLAMVFLQSDIADKTIQSKLNNAIPGKVTWESLNIRIFAGEIEIRDLDFREPGGRKVSSIDRLFIDMDWLPLLKGELYVAKIRIETPRVRMDRDKKHPLNILDVFIDPNAPAPETPPDQTEDFRLPLNVVINALELTNGTASYADTTRSTNLKLSDIRIFLTGNLKDRKGELSLEFKSNRINYQNYQTPVQNFTLSGDYDQNRISDLKLNVVMPTGNMTVKGSLTDIFTSPRLDMDIALSLGLAELKSLVGIQPELSGNVDISARLNGALNNPTADFHLDYRKGVILGYDYDQIIMDLSLNDRRADLKRLHAQGVTGESHVSGSVDLKAAFPEGFLESDRHLEKTSYDFKLTQKKLKIENLMPAGKGITGDISGTADVSGSGITIEKVFAKTNFSIDITNLRSQALKDSPPINIRGNGDIQKNVLSLEKLFITSRDIDISALGNMNLTDKTVSANLSANAEDISPLLTMAGIEQSGGSLSLQSHVSGPVQRPVMDLAVEANDFSVADIIIGNLIVKARLDHRGILNVSKFNIHNQEAGISGSGSLRVFKHIQTSEDNQHAPLVLDLVQVSPRFFAPRSPVKGKFAGRLSVFDLWDTPEMVFNLSGEDVQFKQISLGNIATTLALNEGVLAVTSLDIQNQRSTLNAEGESRIFEPRSLQVVKNFSGWVKVSSDALWLEDFIPDVRGELSLNARVEGDLKNPTGRLHLTGKNINLYGQPIYEVSLDSQLQGNKLSLEPLTVFLAPEESLHLEGEMTQHGTYRLALDVSGVSLSNLQPEKWPDALSGKMDAQFEGQGKFSDPELTGHLKLTDLKSNEMDFSDFLLNVDVKNQSARASGNLGFDVSGTYDLVDKKFSLRAVMDQTDLKPYLSLADNANLSGQISGEMTVAGTAGRMDSYSGKMEVSHVEVLYNQKSLVASDDISIALKNGQVNIERFDLSLLTQGDLTANGTIILGDSLDIQSKGNIPLSLVGFFNEDFSDLSGDLVLTAGADGPLSNPGINGEIRIKDLETEIPGLSQRLNSTNARIMITPQTIVIESLTGKLDSGEFELTGNVDLLDLKPVKFSGALSARELPVSIPGTLDTVFNADLEIKGSPEKSLIKGNLVLMEGLYYKDVKLNLLEAVGQKRRRFEPPPQKSASSIFDNTELDISVTYKNPFIVDNNVGFMEIIPDLSIKGTLDFPVIRGRANVKSGRVEFQKREFEITRGIIDFLNPYKTEPTLDIQARAQIRNWSVQLSLSGTPDELVLDLDSTPPLPNGEILSLIILGRTTGEMRAGEGGTNTSAAQMLSQLVAPRLSEDIKSITGLDIFETEVQSPRAGDDSTGVKITVGKELSDRLTLKYSSQTEQNEMIQKTIAEYKFLETILLNVFQGTHGNFGGSIRYRLEFR